MDIIIGNIVDITTSKDLRSKVFEDFDDANKFMNDFISTLLKDKSVKKLMGAPQVQGSRVYERNGDRISISLGNVMLTEEEMLKIKANDNIYVRNPVQGRGLT